MPSEETILVDVGMRDLPFPMHVASKMDPDGQHTVAGISIEARILHNFQASWIDKFIQVLHSHRHRIGTKTLRANIIDYLHELEATSVRIDFDYPYFIEKSTPVSRERCLVCYRCRYSGKVVASTEEPTIKFRIEIPAITSDPASTPDDNGGLFGQLSTFTLEVQPKRDVFPEDLVALVDSHALAPVVSYMTHEDSQAVIHRVHSEVKTSVETTESIKEALAHDSRFEWYSVRCSNFSMLHSYSTLVAAEKSMWIPHTCYDFEQI